MDTYNLPIFEDTERYNRVMEHAARGQLAFNRRGFAQAAALYRDALETAEQLPPDQEWARVCLRRFLSAAQVARGLFEEARRAILPALIENCPRTGDACPSACLYGAHVDYCRLCARLPPHLPYAIARRRAEAFADAGSRASGDDWCGLLALPDAEMALTEGRYADAVSHTEAGIAWAAGRRGCPSPVPHDATAGLLYDVGARGLLALGELPRAGSWLAAWQEHRSTAAPGDGDPDDAPRYYAARSELARRMNDADAARRYAAAGWRLVRSGEPTEPARIAVSQAQNAANPTAALLPPDSPFVFRQGKL